MKHNTDDIHHLTAYLFREHSGKMVAVLCHKYAMHRMEAVLDIVHDTFEAALLRWKFSGIPKNPEGWLMQVAKNKAINYFKKDCRQRCTDPFLLSSSYIAAQTFETDPIFMDAEIKDSQLRLLLACCQLPLPDKNKIMLTLNILSGFGVPALANALLLKPESVKKALFRSRKLLKEHHHVFEKASPLQNKAYVSLIHTVLYLMFNEGYKPVKSPLINHDLCYEAMRLTKMMVQSSTVLHHESCALLGLMFFNLARFPARLTAAGEIVALPDQDRSKWDKNYITEGYFYLSKVTDGTALSRYHLEAIIASIHCAATHFEETDWKKIGFLYQQLLKLNPSPMMRLNAIVAESYVHGCRHALQNLLRHRLDAEVAGYPYWMVMADLYKRSGMTDKATKAYNTALDLAGNLQDRQFVVRKLLDLEGW